VEGLNVVVANVLSITLFAASLIIALRVFYLCLQTAEGGNYRLVILGLSMLLLAVTALASFASDNSSTLPVNVGWFKYIGQTVCFLYVCLSLLYGKESYLRRLLFWQIVSSLLLFLLLLPIIATHVPYPILAKVLFGGARSVICFIIFLFYLVAFMRKETRFSFLMGTAFLLMSMGYALNVPKYIDAVLLLLDTIGDTGRVMGVVLLLMAMFLG
jgi:hypothetical protein